MTDLPQYPNEPRASYLLRVAAAFIRENHPKSDAVVDDSDCDGNCLAVTLEAEASDLMYAAGCLVTEADSVIRPGQPRSYENRGEA